ncbi:MAG: hypothetical protein GF418_09165 [Chitinivibrionales bacterium]|nr:hypothetical protein [Chitinivibrionales bacterium]MBD3395777.1 hypothetical protein [Chitinivibrionales bacterium]
MSHPALPRAAVVLFVAWYAVCGDSVGTPAKPAIGFSGTIGFSMMRIVRSSAVTPLDNDKVRFLEGAWIESFNGNLGAIVTVSPRLRFSTGLGGSVWSPAQTKLQREDFLGRRENAWISSACAILVLGNPDRPAAEVTGGFFGFNTSPDAQVFGGYLYRSGCYPGYVFSGGATAGLAGLRVRTDVLSPFSLNALATLELEYPYFDLTLGLVPAVDIGGFLETAGGVVAYRVAPADRGLTHPKRSSYINEKGDREYYTLAGTKLMARFTFDTRKAFGIQALGEQDLKLYAEAGLLGVKNYRAIEVASGQTGEIKTVGYEKRLDRMPVMAGFNWPTHPLLAHGILPAATAAFLIALEPDTTWETYDSTLLSQGIHEHEKAYAVDTATHREERGFAHKRYRPIAWGAASLAAGLGTFFLERVLGRPLRLDRIAIEFEYYRLPHENHADFNGEPLPPLILDSDFEAEQDDFRWGLVATKTIMERFSVGFKAASDHFRTPNEFGWFRPEERILATDEWYWEFTLGVSF